MPSNRKQHLLETALKLFYQEGFHSTGIDKILAESGVAKMTLYKHFPSKDDLIRAVLEERDRRFREWFIGLVEEKADSPRERLEAVFDVLDEWVGGKEFRGCMFINAAAEFSSKDEAISKVVADHKRSMCEYVCGLAKDAGFQEPERLSYQLSLLVEGAIVMGHACDDRSAAKKAKGAALTLLESA
jgi:AcrR family transcriptional regulator